MEENKSIKKKIIISALVLIAIFSMPKKVYANEELKNMTRLYFSSGVTQNSGQRRLYFIRKL